MSQWHSGPVAQILTQLGSHPEGPGLKTQAPSSQGSQLSGFQRVRLEGQCAPFRPQGDLAGSRLWAPRCGVGGGDSAHPTG